MLRGILHRFAYFQCPIGTFSRFSINGFTCHMVEREWDRNIPFNSCIPEGVYIARRTSTSSKTKGRDTFEITNVPGRSNIQIHPANWATQLGGCLAPGGRPKCIGGQLGVPDSDDTFDAFMREMEGVDEFELTVTRYAPEYP